MRKGRNKRGGAIVFGVVLALALVVLGCGFLLFSMYMGGQSETKNAADAGCLNVGRKSLDQITVSLDSSDDQSIFKDCTNNSTDNDTNDSGNASLRNINRIWGKALLMGINADAAQSDGQAGSMEGNAGTAFGGAKNISEALSDKLNDQNNLHSFFDDYAGANSTRMIGTNSQVKSLPGANWQTSLMDREDESNIVLNGQPPNFNLPPGYTLPGDAYRKTTRSPVPSGAQGAYFLKGYTAISAANNTYWQVPYQYDEKPHLVSRTTFDAATNATQPLSWDKAVPNAFSAEGSTNSGVSEKAMSWVLTNPRQPFQLSMPHAFFKIHVDDMISKWYFFPSGYPPVEFGPELGYGYTTDTKANVPMPAGGILCSTVTPDDVTLGLDVLGSSLDDIIFGYPSGDSGDVSKIENWITNRFNEMLSVPGKSCSVSDMHNLLSDHKTTFELIAGSRDFYIYSKDGQTLTLNPEPLAVADATWLAPIISNDPDGDEHKIIDDASGLGAIFFSPTVTPDPFCSELLALGWGTYEKDVQWQPGSGYKSCLGKIHVTRWTDVYSLGICNPF